MAENYFSEWFDSLNELRKTKELCDVVIIADGEEIYAHKNILASASPYFRKMFTSSMLEADKKEISIADISYESMMQIVEFIYTSKITLTAENGQCLLLAANFLQIAQLIALCGNFIIKQIDANNGLSMQHLLETCNCDKDIVKRAEDFINHNYQEFGQSEEFIEARIDEVEGLLSSSELCCESEDYVLQSAIRWLEAKSERVEHVHRLLKCIRLSFLSDNSKLLITKQDLFQNNQECQEYMNAKITCNPIPRKFMTTILAITDCDKAMIFDAVSKEWNSFNYVNEEINSIVVHSHYLYTCGKHFGRLDLYTKQWQELARHSKYDNLRPMDVHLNVIENVLYVLERHSSFKEFIYRYDIENNRWEKFAESRGDRIKPAVVALGEYLYVFEGHSYHRRQVTEKFNTVTKEWVDLKPMIHQQYNPVVTPHNGKIYFVDGTNSYPLKKARFQVYDPVKNDWKELAQLTIQYEYIHLVSTYNGIYALAITDRYPIESVHLYNVENNEWSFVAEKHGENTSHACAIPRYLTKTLV